LWGVIVPSSSTVAMNPGPWRSRVFMVVVIPGRVMVAGGLSSSVCVAGINTLVVLALVCWLSPLPHFPNKSLRI
jgi:hypothetical protein